MELEYYKYNNEGETEYPITKYKTWIMEHDDTGWRKLPKPSLNQESKEALEYYNTSNEEDLYFLEREKEAFNEYYNKEKYDIIQSQAYNKKLALQPLLNEAMKRFPIGTEFISLFGAKDIVTERLKTYVVKDGGVFVTGEKGDERMIYDGTWAEITKECNTI